MQNLELTHYLKPQEWILSKVYFDYEGQRFEGRGVLRWDANQGFSLEAPLQGKLNQAVQFRQRLIGKRDRSSIKMHLKNGGIAVSPAVVLANRFDILSENRISILLQDVIFLNRYNSPVGGRESWLGNALYKCGGHQKYWLDAVQIKQEIRVNDYSIESSSSHFRGNHQDAQNSRMTLYAIDEEYIYCDWKAIACTPLESLCLLPDNMQNRVMLKDFFSSLGLSLAKQTKEALLCENIFA